MLAIRRAVLGYAAVARSAQVGVRAVGENLSQASGEVEGVSCGHAAHG